VTGLWKRDVWRVLSRAPFAYLGVESAGGPHVTPVLFAATPDRIWVAVGRGTVKARALRKQPAIGVVVPGEDSSVVVRGQATLLDALPPSPGEMARAPFGLPEFAAHNARELAAFALDAVRSRTLPQPLAPVSIRVEKLDLVAGLTSDAVLGWMGPDGPLALPTRWDPQTGRARVPSELLDGPRSSPACVCIDESTGLGPLAKRGTLVRGAGRATVRSGVATVTIEATRITRWKGFDIRTTAAPARPVAGGKGTVAGRKPTATSARAEA
jgi:nitroimidazol reductase NimA-like FMN-containing flavoprotein (pyridoxamine 5'-phosphate oxidase superfamily)